MKVCIVPGLTKKVPRGINCSVPMNMTGRMGVCVSTASLKAPNLKGSINSEVLLRVPSGAITMGVPPSSTFFILCRLLALLSGLDRSTQTANPETN